MHIHPTIHFRLAHRAPAIYCQFASPWRIIAFLFGVLVVGLFSVCGVDRTKSAERRDVDITSMPMHIAENMRHASMWESKFHGDIENGFVMAWRVQIKWNSSTYTRAQCTFWNGERQCERCERTKMNDIPSSLNFADARHVRKLQITKLPTACVWGGGGRGCVCVCESCFFCAGLGVVDPESKQSPAFNGTDDRPRASEPTNQRTNEQI